MLPSSPQSIYFNVQKFPYLSKIYISAINKTVRSFYLRHVWHFDALRGRWVDLDSRAVNCHRHYCKRYLPVLQTKGQTRQFKDRKKGNQPLNCSSPPTSRATASPHSSTFQWLLMMAQSNRMNINLIIVRSTSDHSSPAQYATPVPRGTIP